MLVKWRGKTILYDVINEDENTYMSPTYQSLSIC